MNYRKYYEDKCNIKIPKDFEIHHIDGNRNNNNIKNLVMLPKELHQEYHYIVEKLKNQFCIEYNITSILDNGNGINEVSHYYYQKFYEIISKCNKYADYRDYLLGYIPNIHRIIDKDIWSTLN